METRIQNDFKSKFSALFYIDILVPQEILMSFKKSLKIGQGLPILQKLKNV